jgi:hypothetical protein
MVFVLPAASIFTEKVPTFNPLNQKSPKSSVVTVPVPSPERVQVAPIITSSVLGSYTVPPINFLGMFK